MNHRTVFLVLAVLSVAIPRTAPAAGSPFYDLKMVAELGTPVAGTNWVIRTTRVTTNTVGFDYYDACLRVPHVDPYSPGINIFTSINDGGKVAFNALVGVDTDEVRTLADVPMVRMLSITGTNAEPELHDCTWLESGGTFVMPDGSVVSGELGLVDLGSGLFGLSDGWASYADDGTIALAAQLVEFDESDPTNTLIVPIGTDVFLWRGTEGDFDLVDALPSYSCSAGGTGLAYCFDGTIQIADDHSILVREYDGYLGRITRYDATGNKTVLHTAETSTDWLAFGRNPSLSRDGKLMVFTGVDTNGFSGLYVQFFDPGMHALTNATCVLSCDDIPLALDDTGAPIWFEPIDLDNMTPVIRHDEDGDGDLVGDSLLVAFKGKPTAASRPNPTTPGSRLLFTDEEGIWTMRIDIDQEIWSTNIVLNARSPMPVMQLNDVMDGATVTNMFLWSGLGRATKVLDGSDRNTVSGDPTPGDHYLAFWVNTTDGPMVIRGAHLDSDGDGLLDHWEAEDGGIDMDRDGAVDLSLFELSARPDHRDVFLEVDWTTPRTSGFPGGWKNEPHPGTFTNIVDMFARAPLQNPDGTNGIVLHVDAGPGSGLSLGITNTTLLEGGDLIQMPGGGHPDMIYMGDEDPAVAPGVRSLAYGDVKDSYFGTTDKRARELAFHYIVLADYYKLQDSIPSATPGSNVLFQVQSVGHNTFTTFANLDQDGDLNLDVNLSPFSSFMFTSGPAAGQVRHFTQTPVVIGGNSFQINFPGPIISPPPQPGDSFVLFTGSSGRSEVNFRLLEPWNLENQHSFPGNDVIITLAVGGPDANGRLGTKDVMWRTIAHELGHNLGLRHGGDDVLCQFTGDRHLSLMSYTHQLRSQPGALLRLGGPTCSPLLYPDPNPATPQLESTFLLPPPGFAASSPVPGVVMSYSDGTDALGFNEWEEARYDLWGTLQFVGNTYMRLNGDIPDIHEEFAPRADALPDRSGPTIQLVSPDASTPTPIGLPLELRVEVIDESGVDLVQIGFDADGDGASASPGETQFATLAGPDEFTVTAPTVGGADGTRTVVVTATDLLGNASVAQANLIVGSGSIPDTQRPNISLISPTSAIRLAVNDQVAVELRVTDSQSAIDTVWMSLDLDDDGSLNTPGETVIAYPAGSDRYHVLFSPLTGNAGSRTLTAVATDIWRNSRTNTFTLQVRPFDETPPSLSIVYPPDGADIPLGSVLSVTASATDDSSLSAVTLGLDEDGDSLTDTFLATSSGESMYSVNFGWGLPRPPGLTGPTGLRTIHATAIDEASNSVMVASSINVVDLTGPFIEFVSPTPFSVLPLGSAPQVRVKVTDYQAVAGVSLGLDLNGDGSISGPGEQLSATPGVGNEYSATFASLDGPESERQFLATAWDPSGQTSVVAAVFIAAPHVAVVSPAQNQTIQPHETLRVHLTKAQTSSFSALTVSFDVNGDGDTADPNETVPARLVQAPDRFAAAFANIQGPPGARSITVNGTLSGGGSTAFVRDVAVGSFGGYASSVSQKRASLPLLPELPDAGPFPSSGPTSFLSTPEFLYFAAGDRGAGGELFRTDGTPEGTILLRDINPDWMDTSGLYSDDIRPGSSTLAEFVAMDGFIVFRASNGNQSSFGVQIDNNGPELWRSDGTTEGTVMVTDIRPGREGSAPEFITRINNQVCFVANDGVTGKELWTSDGTAGGTSLLHEFKPGITSSDIGELTAGVDAIYFRANFNELWKTDGTDPGTVLVKQVSTLPGTAIGSMQACGSLVFFIANEGTTGSELWRTDGSEAGTFLLRDIDPGSSGSSIADLTCVGSQVFFSAESPDEGRELWVSDGTPAGTRLVRDIVPGPFSSTPENLIAFNGRLYFSAGDAQRGVELWESDATEEGTKMVVNLATSTVDAPPGGVYPNRNASPRELAVFNGELYFSADDGLGLSGRELWKTDGTEAGTRLVKDLQPMPGVGSDPRNLTVWNGALYFSADDGAGQELWRSDGTAAGTVRLRNIAKQRPPQLESINTEIFMTAADGVHGREPWLADGFGTHMLVDLVPGTIGSSPTNAARLGTDVVFQGVDPANTNATALFHTDGTTAGTQTLGSFSKFGSSIAFPPTEWNGFLYFTGSGNSKGLELWKTDGTSGGTGLVKDIRPNALDSTPINPGFLNDRLVFSAQENAFGREPWVTDGTEGGTMLLTNLNNSTLNSDPRGFTRVGDELLFTAKATGLGEEVWATDGTTAGTRLVKDILSGGGSSIMFQSSGAIFEVGPNELYFQASDGTFGHELWATDGTESGTRMVADVYPGSNSSEGRPDYMTLVGKRLFFAGNSSVSVEPWMSDGTSAGTVLLKNIRRRASGGFEQASNPREFVDLLGLALFLAYHDDYGWELWRSDGTTVGTMLIKDIFPGARSPRIAHLTVVGPRVFFTADDGEHGRELWMSDGTFYGTRMVEDLIPGPGSSDPQALTDIGGQLHYFADDGAGDLSLRALGDLGPTDFESWMAGYPALSGDHRLAFRDPDLDGLSSILEHDLGLAPSIPSSNPRPAAVSGFFDGGWMNFEITYLRRQDFAMRGLRYGTQRSRELDSWLAAFPVSEVSVDLGGGFEATTFRFQRPLNETTHFFQIVFGTSP